MTEKKTFLKVVGDSLVNLVSGLGTARDKVSGNAYGLRIYDDQELMIAYRSAWLARKIVNIPAMDATRKWRDWQAKKEQIELIDTEEKRLGVQGKFMEAMIKARLFGGSAIYIGTGEQDISKPLDPAQVGRGGVKFLTVLPKRSLQAGQLVQDPASPLFNKPGMYTLVATEIQKEIHPSRLAIFTGEDIPDNIFGVGGFVDGWGDSVLMSTLDPIKHADGTAANIASLIFEAKVDVIRLPNFMSSLSDPSYTDRIMKRYGLAATGKGINGTLLLDKDEEYEQKTANFTTLPDVLMGLMQVVAGAADIPMTRLLGMTPGGLAATGESDLRNYYDRVSAMQTLQIDPGTQALNECLIVSALGSRPAEVHYIWGSLWQVSDKERAEIGKLDMETIKGLNETSLFPPEALANAAVTLLMEHSILPSLQEQIDDAGGLPDYEAELEAERQLEADRLAAKAKPVTDALPKSLYVRRDVLNGKEIAKHYRDQGLMTMDPAKMHVTIIYSKAPVDWFATGQAWEANITLNPGGARDHAFFGPPGLEDSLVLMIKSQELEWRHEIFKGAGAQSSYEEYQPHISLKYYDTPQTGIDLSGIEPWQGKIELGPEIYEEVKSKVDDLDEAA